MNLLKFIIYILFSKKVKSYFEKHVVKVCKVAENVNIKVSKSCALFDLSLLV